MSKTGVNQRSSKSNAGVSRQHVELLAQELLKLAAACRVELNEGTLAVYMEDLAGYRSDILIEALSDVRKSWAEPSKMPPIGVIASACESVSRYWATGGRPLGLPEGPVDDSTPEERRKYVEELRKRIESAC